MCSNDLGTRGVNCYQWNTINITLASAVYNDLLKCCMIKIPHIPPYLY